MAAFKDVLMSAGNIAADEVEALLMTVPYIGELYSAALVFKDLPTIIRKTNDTAALKSKIEDVNGFKRYLISAGLNE